MNPAFYKIDRALKDESAQEVIPALASYLAAAGALSERDREEFINYVADMINTAFDEFNRRKT
jgi:hypothetical protein